MEYAGILEYNDKSYHFALNNNIVSLIGKPFEFYNDFKDLDNVEAIYGVTTSNRYIVFINCEFIQSFFGSSNSFSVQGYAISTNNMGESCDFTFHRCSFRASALNTFFAPQKAKIIKTGINPANWDGSIDISINSFSETTKTFKYQDATCELSISRNINLKQELSILGEFNSVFSFIYESSQTITKSVENIRTLFDFLSFLNYSTDITFNDIFISRKNDEGKFKKTATLHFFNKNSGAKFNQFNSITIEDIPDDKLESVFSKIASLRKTDNRLRYYYPQNNYEATHIDPGKWLIAAINFEGLFTTTFPDYKANSKEFSHVKEIVKKTTDKIDISQFTRQEKRFLKSFKNHIERYDGSLEGKFNHLLKENKGALETILKYNTDKLSIKSSDNYGLLYSKYRNKLAHGAVEPLSDKEVAVYRLLEPMIYLLLLHSVGLKQDELKVIIDKLFR